MSDGGREKGCIEDRPAARALPSRQDAPAGLRPAGAQSETSYEVFFSAFADGFFVSGLAAGAAFGLQKSGSASAHCLEG
jgi:hypothetical protein